MARHVLVALLAIGFFLSTSYLPKASAGNVFDGIYLSAHSDSIEYFSLTNTNGGVAGFLYGIGQDASAPDGIREFRTNVSGATDGTRVNFRQGQGTFSTTLGWSAVMHGDGFDMMFQAKNGYLQRDAFRAADPEAVNAAIARFRTSVGRVRAADVANQERSNVQSELMDAEQRLDHDIALRPSRSQAIVKAKAEVARANAETLAAQNRIAAREADVVAAQRIADLVKASATDGEEMARAGSLQADVGARRANVGAAHADLGSANAAQSSANFSLAQARRENAMLEARIDELRRIIAKDQTYLR